MQDETKRTKPIAPASAENSDDESTTNEDQQNVTPQLNNGSDGDNDSNGSDSDSESDSDRVGTGRNRRRFRRKLDRGREIQDAPSNGHLLVSSPASIAPIPQVLKFPHSAFSTGASKETTLDEKQPSDVFYPSSSLKSSGKLSDVSSTTTKSLFMSSSTISGSNRTKYSNNITTDGKRNSHESSKTSRLSMDTPTHRMTRRRRGRRSDYNSDDDDDDDDSDDDDSDENDNGTRRTDASSTRASNSRQSRHSSELYNTVGAVAVYSTGVLVSQTPAVLTQPTEEDRQRHDREDDEENLNSDHDNVTTPVDAESYAVSEGQRSTHGSTITSATTNNLRNILLGDDESPRHEHRSDETIRTAEVTIENSSIPAPPEGARCTESTVAMPNDNMKKSGGTGSDKKKEDITVRLPWYWNPVFWGIVGILIVALAVALAVVLVSDDDDDDDDDESLPRQKPTFAPTTVAPTMFSAFDTIKVQALNRYIPMEYHVWKEDPSSPQAQAYRWLMSEDEVTQFSDFMDTASIETMKTRYSLAVFYYALRGNSWYNDNYWLDGRLGHCSWQFVDCRVVGQGNFVDPLAEFRPVTGLQIPKNNLNGSLPNELMNLSNLAFLVLPENTIGSIKALGNGLISDSLQWVNLSGNPLQSHESIFHLTNLEGLIFSDTQFNGSLPIEIQKLSKLRTLDLSNNQLFGPLEGHFATMDHLEVILLDLNRFDDKLDDILDCGNCSSTLTYFSSKGGNPLTGSLPDRLSQFSMLQHLSIAQSKLTGSIPSGIGRLTELTTLDLSQNHYFSKSIGLPTEIGNLVNLKNLTLSASALGGTISPGISNLSHLERMDIDRTSMTGSIPAEVCNLGNLTKIYHSDGVYCSCTGKDICVLVTDV